MGYIFSVGSTKIMSANAANHELTPFLKKFGELLINCVEINIPDYHAVTAFFSAGWRVLKLRGKGEPELPTMPPKPPTPVRERLNRGGKVNPFPNKSSDVR